jgi:hypothetical protein
VGIFSGLVFGGALGMDRGMRTLRESLPKDSQLLRIIHENDDLKKQQETLFSGPIDSAPAEIESEGPEDLLAATQSEEAPELDLLETQLLLDAGEGK